MLGVGLANHRHEHLLTLGQVVAIGHRDLETQVWVVKVVKNSTPEGNILVALDIYVHKVSIILGRKNLG
jgi:hypothetical protein